MNKKHAEIKITFKQGKEESTFWLSKRDVRLTHSIMQTLDLENGELTDIAKKVLKRIQKLASEHHNAHERILETMDKMKDITI